MNNIYLLNEEQMQTLCDKLCAYGKETHCHNRSVTNLLDMLMKLPSINAEEFKTLNKIARKIVKLIDE